MRETQMSKTTITIPEELQEWVDEKVAECGYHSPDEYIADLIRKDRLGLDRLRHLLLQGTLSPIVGPADDEYFEGLRNRVREGKKT